MTSTKQISIGSWTQLTMDKTPTRMRQNDKCSTYETSIPEEEEETPIYKRSSIQRRSLPKMSPSRKMSVPTVSFAPGEISSSRLESSFRLANVRRFSESYQRRLSRFSNVSDAVSRKLSTTIGWRTVSVQDIICQSRSLCGQYMRMRLKRSGIFNRRLGLSRLESTSNLPPGSDGSVGEVFAQLQVIGSELENKHPKLYTCICRQVAVTIANEKSVSCVLSSIAINLFKSDITWAKIASLYCVAGGLAVDCVLQGHPEYIYGIVETMGLVIERDVALWIAQQGGWSALLSRYRPPDDDSGALQMIALSVFCLIVLLLGAIFGLRTVGKLAFGHSMTLPL